MKVEEALDAIVRHLPPVAGNGWTREQDEADGTKVYIVRVKE